MYIKIAAVLLLLAPFATAGQAGIPQAFGLYSSAMGKANTGDKPLTRTNCIEIALSESPSHQAARHAAAAASESAAAAFSSYYPNIALNTGYRRFQTHAFLPNRVLTLPGISSSIGPEDQWNANVKATYTVFDSGRRRADVTSARAVSASAAEEAERNRQTVAYSVSQAYYNLLSAFEGRRIAKEHLSRGEEHLRLAKERKAAGMVPQADVMRSQVEVANARLQLVRAETAVQFAGGDLNTAMGRNPGEPLTIVQEQDPLLQPELLDLQYLSAQAKKNRSEVKAAIQLVKRGEAELAAAKGTFGPKVNAEAGYGWLDSKFLPKDEDWAVGISLQWPLFSGFESVHATGRARAELERRESDQKQVELLVANDVWKAVAGVKESYESVMAADVARKDAAESLRLAQARYEAGAGTVNDLVDAETAMEAAEISHSQAIYSHYIAVARLRLVTGEI